MLVFAAGLIGPTDAAATDVPAAVARTVDPGGQESPLITLGIAAAGVAALGAWRLTRVSPRRRPAPQPARRREVIVLR